MERFKIELYEQEYGKSFPSFKHLSTEECEIIKKIFFLDFQVENDLELIKIIEKKAIYIDNFNANDEQNFNLKRMFQYLNRDCLKIYVNWFCFDNIDEIAFDDFSTFFYDIWFPGADDIDLFDESYSWIVSIRHDGVIYIYNCADTKQQVLEK